MKKSLVIVSLVASLLPAPAQAQSAGGYAVEFVEAHANWVAGRSVKGSPLFRFVSVARDAEPAAGTMTIAEVGKVRCSSRAARRSFFYACKVSGRVLFLRAREFEFDAGLRSAKVRFTAHGRDNRVAWASRDDHPKPAWGLHGGERALIAEASLTASATVRGSVLGERFSTKNKKAQATLRRGVQAGLLYDTGLRTFTVREATQRLAWRELRRAIASL